MRIQPENNPNIVEPNPQRKEELYAIRRRRPLEPKEHWELLNLRAAERALSEVESNRLRFRGRN